MNHNKVPCVIIRGGTSKGIYLNAADLPRDTSLRDAMILDIFGSPDQRQIDGLGGADVLTSKLAIIEPSDREGIDIDYTFGQVAIDSPSINYSLNCGNILSGAAIYAVDNGLVKITTPATTVNIFNTNTKTRISAQVLIDNHRSATSGDFKIDGVPGTGSPIQLTFNNTTGAFTGTLLPTGNPIDTIKLETGKEVGVSIIDAGNLYAIIEANSIELEGSESPDLLQNDTALIHTCQDIMKKCSNLINATINCINPINLQKLAIVSPYIPTSGNKPCDFIGRIISLNGKVHKSFAVTGAISTASSALVPNTVLNNLIQNIPNHEFTIGHPEGILNLVIETESDSNGLKPIGASIKRTARRIMDGYVYIKPSS